MTNIGTLSRHGVKKIITHCPHCLNSLRQDYSQFDGHYEVTHHTQFLGELVAAGKLLGVELLDHVVIGNRNRFVSLNEKRLGFS